MTISARPRIHFRRAPVTITVLSLLALAAAFYVYKSSSSVANGFHAAPRVSHYGGLRVTYQGTDSTGVETYEMSTPDDGPGAEKLLVLAPTHPARGMAHNYLFVLPVEAGLETDYGDGLRTLQRLDAENRYDLTIVEPTFAVDPWYANDPTDGYRQYETFMVKQLVPWVKANLAKAGSEQTWLIGFSKSGIGGQDLILKHPDVFSLVASWDFPADMSSYRQYGAVGYGTQSNFDAHYQLTKSFVAAHKQPFEHANRIWIGGYDVFGPDIKHYDALLSAERIEHTTGPLKVMAHRWDSGWVPEALAALHSDSKRLRSTS